MRQNAKEDYRFLGRIGYLTHDKERQRPVYFQWQLLNWDELSDNAGTTIPVLAVEKADRHDTADISLEIHAPPPPVEETEGTSTELFRGRKKPDYAIRDQKNRVLGEQGELLVLEYERARLLKAGKGHLSAKVRHVSKLEGDGAGYDILSFNEDGTKRFIEVKTTRGDASTAFFVSANEIRFADHADRSYFLYRVYDFDRRTGRAKFFIHNGPLRNSRFSMEPTNYRLSIGNRKVTG